MRLHLALIIIVVTLSACATEPQRLAVPELAGCQGTTPPPGSNQVLRAPVSLADGLEVIVSDVVIPPNATVPRHFHPGEEFIYVLAGSAVHVEEGKADRLLAAGDSYVIPPRAVHAPRAGPHGGRAIVFRLHVVGTEERTLVPE